MRSIDSHFRTATKLSDQNRDQEIEIFDKIRVDYWKFLKKKLIDRKNFTTSGTKFCEAKIGSKFLPDYVDFCNKSLKGIPLLLITSLIGLLNLSSKAQQELTRNSTTKTWVVEKKIKYNQRYLSSLWLWPVYFRKWWPKYRYIFSTLRASVFFPKFGT